MITETILAQDPVALRRALEILQSGGLVAFPTDTVYGLGALAFNKKAVESIYQAKQRLAEKAIPVLIADIDDLSKVSVTVSEIAMKLATRFWPGPLTLVVPKNPALSEAISADETVGVRIPDHPTARSLLRLVGPMAVTSANRSGMPAPCTALEVSDQLGGRIALILDCGKTPGGVPSTVVDCTGSKLKFLRMGPVPEQEILAVIK